MRIPQSPPAGRSFGTDRLSQILGSLDALTANDRYLHWHDLRRRPAPEGFTHEEWWFALKLRRGSRLQNISLRDKKGRSFRFGVPDALTEQLHHIDRGLGFAVDLPEAVSRSDSRDQYIVSTLIQEAITSSQLEGAATTREVAKEMLRSGRPPRDKGERMILNNYLTMQRIRDLRTEPLSPELVCELQARVTEGTLERPDAAGRLRREDEPIHVVDEIDGTVFHDPPVASELPERLRLMCEFANSASPGYFIHPAVRAIILHFWLAYDHPFVDGNGRTARALFYWAMLRAGYTLFEFVSISQILLRAPVRYAQAFLHTETDENDLTYFVLHQADVIRESVEALHAYVRHKTAELRAAERCLRGLHDLNYRQQALLAHALRETGVRYTIIAHQRSHSISHPTARADLNDLVQRGLLVMRKQGKSYVFQAPADLSEKLGRISESSITTTADQTLPLPLSQRSPLP